MSPRTAGPSPVLFKPIHRAKLPEEHRIDDHHDQRPDSPTTTAGTAPSHAAVMPDSNAPSSLDATMNIVFTAPTRPRISCGVRTCTTVDRMTTLTMSDAPRTTSAASESGKLRERPKTMVATPKIATHDRSSTPARPRIGR